MISWKEWFERINKELDLIKRKKHALDDLYNVGKISQHIYEYLDKEVTEDIAEIETRRKALTEKMTRKLNRLEEQLRTLEIFLATSEMAYAAEEISQEVHAAESNAIILGMEATKQELNMIREVIIQLVPKETAIAPAPAPTSTPVETVESTLTKPVIEKQPEATTNAPIKNHIEPIPVPLPSETTTITTTNKPEGNKEGQG